jgi:hypothetical protein
LAGSAFFASGFAGLPVFVPFDFFVGAGGGATPLVLLTTTPFVTAFWLVLTGASTVDRLFASLGAECLIEYL